MDSDSSSPLICVTGASGYLASHVIHQLLSSGQRVRGTVRCLTDEAKVKPIRQLVPDATYPIELVQADLLNAESWMNAVSGCQYVLHIASPFPIIEPADPNVLIQPALQGTLSILRAAHASGGVRRVVVTSSGSAVSNGLIGLPGHKKNVPYTESDWTDPASDVSAYTRSKVLAERAAWKFVEDLPDDDPNKFELVTLTPAGLYGPVLYGDDFTSLELPRRLMGDNVPFLPKMNVPLVDVRDVATAHIRAMQAERAANQRIIVHSGTTMSMKEIALGLEEEFEPQGYSITTSTGPNCCIRCASLCDGLLKWVVPTLGKYVTYDISRLKDILNVQPRDVTNTVIDMCYTMVDLGIVKKTAKYRGRNKSD